MKRIHAGNSIAVLTLSLCLPGATLAQYRTQPLLDADRSTAPRSPTALVQAAPSNPSTVALVLGGLAGGAVGYVGGGLVGYAIDARDCGSDDWFCGLGGFVLGAAIGEATLLPLGVHLANGSRGNYGQATLLSFGIVAGGMLMALVTTPAVLLAVPVVQLITSVDIERTTG
jgi:hypothetical protein